MKFIVYSLTIVYEFINIIAANIIYMYGIISSLFLLSLLQDGLSLHLAVREIFYLQTDYLKQMIEEYK